MPAPRHPKEALFAGETPFPVIPACEHFAGSEKLIAKALDLQERLGAVFDITCDCEDGAEAGREKAHAEMIVGLMHSSANRFAMAGARIEELPVHHRPRAAGTSKYTNWGRLKETLWDLWAVRWMQKRYRPIRVEEPQWIR